MFCIFHLCIWCIFSAYLVLHILAYFEMLISASWCILCIYMHILSLPAYVSFTFQVSFRLCLEQIGDVGFYGRFRAWFKVIAFNTRTGKVFQLPADSKCCAPAIAACSLAWPISLIQIQTACARGQGSFFHKLFLPLFLSLNRLLTQLNIPKVDDLVLGKIIASNFGQKKVPLQQGGDLVSSCLSVSSLVLHIFAQPLFSLVITMMHNLFESVHFAQELLLLHLVAVAQQWCTIAPCSFHGSKEEAWSEASEAHTDSRPLE